MREALLWEKLDGNRVKCNLCARRCVIDEGKRGFCRCRVNIDGKLYTLSYGKLVAMNIDPIEKKPLFHFYPGSAVLSICTPGCNFGCIFCCNWMLSQAMNPDDVEKEYPPEFVVEYARKYECDGISYTYTEPTVFFEYALDCMKLAKKYNIFNTFVTNGYLTPEAVDMLKGYLDAATVDVKGCFSKDFYLHFMRVPDPEPILQCLEALRDAKVFIEITNLVVPEVDADEESFRLFLKKVYDLLGPEVPLHVIRFHPNYRLIDVPPTPVKMLEKFHSIAREMGFKYVYIGNVPGHKFENTYCPECNALLIRRYGFEVLEYRVTDDGRCPECGARINIVGGYRRGKNIWLTII